jgi:hypothetical protein
MPAAKPVPPLPAQDLDEGLTDLFRRLLAEPAPAALISLADQLEEAWLSARPPAEARAIG